MIGSLFSPSGPILGVASADRSLYGGAAFRGVVQVTGATHELEHRRAGHRRTERRPGKAGLAVLGLTLLGLALSGCGRKGPLDPPPGATGPEPAAQGQTAGSAPANQAQTAPNKRIFLDGLLN
jgi:predicted small lipoprotein YifL